MENGNGRTITLIIAAVSLTFGISMGGVVLGLNGRVKENELQVRKIDVVLEKIENVEEHIAEIKQDFKEHVRND